MKAVLLFSALAAVSLPSLGSESSFTTVQFGDVAQIALPRNWTYLDNDIAAHLNTSSEAVARVAGAPIYQGDNKILVAANAYDAAGKSKATLRLSVRVGQTTSQGELGELSKQSPKVLQEALMPTAKETAEMMAKVPGVRSSKVVGVKLDFNGTLYCTSSTFESDQGGRSVIADIWVCPMGNRNLKLSTSYEKRYQSIYRPTVDYVWGSLSAK